MDELEKKLQSWIREMNRGILELFVLALIKTESMHGAQISKRMYKLSEGKIELKPGTIYPLLKRLEEDGWIKSQIHQPEGERGPERHIYFLTSSGDKLFQEMLTHFSESIYNLLYFIDEEFGLLKRLQSIMKELDKS
ncbi:MAG: PadR family transcriptional regulator [Candidatus Jordarchaeum sp.]|uniref:PadR family transcriptional regulator n=1 Tax=Candidatus Jordarchaeum sp. TaxID=2823881 RepID=UPI00404A4E31